MDLAAERAASFQRRSAGIIERRARKLLERTSWKASVADLRREYRRWWDEDLMRATVEVAQRLQQRYGVFEGNGDLPKEGDEFMAKKTDAKALKRWLWEWFDAEGDVPTTEAQALFERMKKALGYGMKYPSFEVTYFYPVRKEWREAQEEYPAEEPEEAEPTDPPAAEEEAFLEPRGACPEGSAGVPAADNRSEGAKLRALLPEVSERASEVYTKARQVQVALFGDQGDQGRGDPTGESKGLIGDAAISLHNSRCDLSTALGVLNQILEELE